MIRYFGYIRSAVIVGPTKPASVLHKQSARNLELTTVFQLRAVSFFPLMMQYGETPLSN